jgi:DNA-binding protein YbaB
MFGKVGQGLNNAGNMIKAKQQADQMQKMMQAISVQGVSKNGKVNITLNGEYKIVDLKIDGSLINFVFDSTTSKGKEDTSIAKFVMEAYEDASKKVQNAIMKKFQEEGNIGDLMSMLGGN